MNHITTRVANLCAAFGIVGIGVAAAIATPAQAQDYTVGANARIFAMGGAGLALTHFGGTDGRANPASLAFERNAVTPTFPSIGVRSQGPASANAGSSYLFDGIRSGDAISLAGQFGTAPSTLGVNAFTGLRMGKFEVSASAVGEAHVLPNAAWSNWVVNGQQLLNNLPSNAKTDIYAGGYYTEPAVNYANTLPSSIFGDGNRVALGIRVKKMVGMYSHLTVEPEFDASVNHTTIAAIPATEMGGLNKLQDTGMGADFGLMVRPKGLTGVSFGLVADNFVKPAFNFTSIDTAGKVNHFNLVQSTLSMGMGWEAPSGLTLAADIDNIGGGNDLEGNPTRDMRVGMEQKFFKVIALRGGYSKLNGATYGVGFFGLDVAFGHNVPLEVVRSLNF